MGRKLRKVAWLLVLSMMPISSLQAHTEIRFSGVVTVPLPCVISGKQAIETHFGDALVTTQVNGDNYLKTVSYDLICRNNSSNSLRMKIQGNAADFNPQALQTNMHDLGIELRADGQPLLLNAWFNFTYPELPKLQAVPIKRLGSTLPTGSFLATATMLVDYQ
ncbi:MULTISPECIES: fimbrial protein [Serratia]|uniref:fimbrial protein n=1 Tax=Serratia TaxID=613 RepID=UPI0020A3CD63|nr:fimbrial protein [Serratia marcescens]